MVTQTFYLHNKDWIAKGNYRRATIEFPDIIANSVSFDMICNFPSLKNISGGVELYGFETFNKGNYIDKIYTNYLFNYNTQYGCYKIILEITDTTTVLEDVVITVTYNSNLSIVLLNNYSEPHRIVKYNFLELYASVSGTFRDSVSVIEPVFEVFLDKYPTVNYVYINTLNRYYFVDDIILVRTGLYRFICHCDVLMSFRKDILELDVFVTRQEFNFNKYIPDEKMPIENVFLYDYSNVGEGLTFVNSRILFPLNNNTTDFRFYALTVVSAGLGVVTAEQYKDVVATPYNKTSITFLLNGKDLQYVTETILGNTEYINAIKHLWNDNSDAFISVKQFPWNLSDFCHTVAKSTWYIGSAQVKFNRNLSALIFNSEDDSPWVEIYCGEYTFPKLYNDWRDYRPYTKISLFIPYVGWVELDNAVIYSDNFRSDGIHFRYVVDLVSGDCIFQLYNYLVDGIAVDPNNITNANPLSKINIIEQYNCNPCDNVLISNSNHLEVLRKGLTIASNVIETVASGIAGGGAALAKANAANMKQKGVTRNAKQIATDKAQMTQAKADITSNTFSSVSDFVVALMSDTRGSKNYSTNSAGFINLDTRTQFLIRYEKLKYVEPEGYAHLVGRPSNYKGKLKDLQGYTEVGGVHLEGISTATSEEISIIENNLKSGVLCDIPKKI